MREMAEAKRASRINELENETKNLEFLLSQLVSVEEEEIPPFLKQTGYVSKLEIEASLVKVTQSLRKVKGDAKPEPVETEDKGDSSTSEKYSLINVPDDMLTPEQVPVYSS